MASVSQPKASKSQNPDEPVTKRLHIGGLTPAITLVDLNKRLASFGVVEGDISGIGQVDAVGRPRSFVHLTLRTTAGKFSKCMNVLSGSTWKGAKLRLGEAKPDYRERLEAERTQDALLAAQPPRKKQRTHGVHAADMSLVTPDLAAKKAGWTVTPMGRVLRPIKMRPEHPLPPTLEEIAKAKALKSKNDAKWKKGAKGKMTEEEKKEERRRRKKEPPVRARAVKIDVTKWGSTQLKGMFLESQTLPGMKRKAVEMVEEPMADDEDESSDEEEIEEESEADSGDEEVEDDDMSIPAERASSPLFPFQPTAKTTASSTTTVPAAAARAVIPDNNTDVDLEKSRALDLLSSLFAGRDEDDWVGRESAGSDVDEEALLKHERRPPKGEKIDMEFEIVPKDGGVSAAKVPVVNEEDESEEDEEEGKGVADEDEPKSVGEEAVVTEPATTAQVAPNLKDMFAPRENEGGFSLLGHLDIDLDLDEELAFALEAAPTTATPTHAPTLANLTAAPTTTATTTTTTTYINPREPLFFFPSLSSFTPSHPSSMFFTSNPSKKSKDAVDVLAEKGWHWRGDSVRFYRTQGEEEIRKEWEEKRGDLTKGWKRRAREAGKAGRRRRGGVVEE